MGYTTVKIAVDKTYVGAKTTHYSFDVLGGTINGESLTVSGSPQFNIGKSALIFAENSKVVGFAQGAFEIKGNAAVRGFGVNIKKGPNNFNFKATLPDETEAKDCLQIKVDNQYSNNWSLRTIDTSNASENELELFPITVLKGNQYQFIGCS